MGTVRALFTENGAQIPVAGAVYQPAQTSPHHSAAAHEAGLAAGVEGVFPQIRNTGLGAEAPQQAGLCVEGGVAGAVHLVFVAANDGTVFDQYGAEGFVAVLCGGFGQAQSLLMKRISWEDCGIRCPPLWI